MRRYASPFNGNRYILNKNTGEIHDLDNESSQCKIEEIKPEHVMNVISYEDALIRAKAFKCPHPNGCYYCLPEYNQG